ncbi:uncharacterized protein LOC100370466 [Saccoglossus kowalevskii]|uniref:GDP-fucose protein O-fucosyltransferase 2 n=1 Tax=Saccoglossus kowalevskii TaxID=10224 RepID=A0ABM0GSN1_SACKO|nr:PREDICTED: uncharacterized protein LOC100370466 [Saccoglossus kowalevskii]
MFLCWKYRKWILLLLLLSSVAVLMNLERHVSASITSMVYGNTHINTHSTDSDDSIQHKKYNVELNMVSMNKSPTLIGHTKKTKKVENTALNGSYSTRVRGQSITNVANITAPFLLGIQRSDSGGQNNQYLAMEKVIVMALLSNRTLVMTPFFLHGGHVRGYSTEHMRQFNDTFDVKILNELLPLATVDEFREKCTSKETKVVTWNLSAYQRSKEKLFDSELEIRLPDNDDVIMMKKVDIHRLEEIVNHAPCLGIYQSSRSRLQVNNTEEMLDKVRTHLRRSANVRNVTDRLLTGFCGGKPYLAMHWRNKSAEMPCYFQRDANKCNKVKSQLSEVVPNITQAVAKLMKQRNISCLYISCPEWSLSILDHFSKVLPSEKVFSLRDLPVNKDNTGIMKDYYFKSLVEQEICYRSEIFLAARMSSWSEFVVNERNINHKRTYLIRQLPGVPEYKRPQLI